MGRKEGLLRIERERWVAFSELEDRVPGDRSEEPTLNEDGWSVKDLPWHMASWDREHIEDHAPELSRCIERLM